MRILTVRQPWAEAIIFGGKDVENRVRNIAGDYRGQVAIHTGTYRPSVEEWERFADAHPEAFQRMAREVPWNQPEHGVIIGIVDLIDVHRPRWDYSCSDDVDGECSPWAELDGWPYHLVLANPRPLAEPIPYRGALGLRRLDAEMVARIEAAIA
jgi:hypothetical protein